jgi:hypothetical protein
VIFGLALKLEVSEVAFTLGVKDSCMKSPNTKLVVQDLNVFTMKILC